MNLENKKEELVSVLEGYSLLAIAFSGGVDSMFLAATAAETIKGRVMLFTLVTPLQARLDICHAEKMARKLQLPYQMVHLDLLDQEQLVRNTKDRCYHCKQAGFSLLQTRAMEKGFSVLAHGVNVDDLGDYRPGLRATAALGVVAPLVEAGLTKADIRRLSREMNLETWNMPSQSCLATRVPYGEKLTREKLARIEQAEDTLHGLGFTVVRVRHHGPVARIECDPESIQAIAADPLLRQKISGNLRKLGFEHVALDLEGYASGSMNVNIAPERCKL